MREWLQHEIAKDPKIGIATGLEMLSLHRGVELLYRTFAVTNASLRIPTLIELIVHIEALLREKKVELPVRLQGKGEVLPLAQALGPLFLRYGIYGKGPPQLAWQAALWHQLQESWDFPLDFLRSPTWKGESQEGMIHLFAFSHLPELYLQFFEKLSEKIPVVFYALSPCMEFWSELRPRAVEERSLRRQGVSERTLAAFEAFHKENNPLLAQWGSVGARLAASIEERGFPTQEEYLEPQGQSALHTLQRALLHNLSESPEAPKDGTIELHVAPTLYEEIKQLHARLTRFIVEEGIEPRHILVMAPDIAPYAPAIRALFKEIPARLLDLPPLTSGSLYEGLLLLLSLEEKRWSARSLLQLFSHPLFCRKQNWKRADLAQIQQWVERMGILWGRDLAHRNQLLKGAYCTKGLEEKEATWDRAMERLFGDLATGEEGCVDSISCELLGQLQAILTQLAKECAPFFDGSLHSWEEWREKLKELLALFFDTNEETLCLDFPLCIGAEERVPFSTFFTLFKQIQSQEKREIAAHELQAVTFCSLQPMRSLPAQVICLMGMHQQAFPRSDPNRFLDPLPLSLRPPSCAEEDRYLLLEAILSARHALLFSYPTSCSTQEEELMPSLLLQEFLQRVPHCLRIESPSKHRAPLPSPPAFFSTVKKERAPSSQTLLLADLLHFCRNPLAHYAQKKLRIFFKKERLPEEPFLLSPLALTRYRREGERGILMPFGLFGKLAERRLVREEAEMARGLEEWGIQAPLQTWEAPPYPLQTAFGEVHLSGRLEGLFPQGLLAWEKSSFASAIRHLPSFLLLAAVGERGGYAAERLLLAREGGVYRRFFTSPDPLLRALVEAYFHHLETPSFLLPEWLPALLKGDEEALGKEIAALFTPRMRIYRPEVHALFRGEAPSASEVMARAQEEAKRLYKEVEDGWA